VSLEHWSTDGNETTEEDAAKLHFSEELVVEETYRTCKRDGFPMLKIRGRWQCVAEYLDRCIGQQGVVDLIQQGDTVYTVFENGHELPMLCFCCGTPLAYDDLERSRQDMRGRRLEAMSFDMVTVQDGSEVLQFRLEFSKKGSSPGVFVPVAVEVAARLRHSDHCPRKGKPPQKKSRRPKRRRKR
jgi:hypothetical protein